MLFAIQLEQNAGPAKHSIAIHWQAWSLHESIYRSVRLISALSFETKKGLQPISSRITAYVAISLASRGTPGSILPGFHVPETKLAEAKEAPIHICVLTPSKNHKNHIEAGKEQVATEFNSRRGQTEPHKI